MAVEILLDYPTTSSTFSTIHLLAQSRSAGEKA
jgi:hypothetical protein